MEVKKQITMNVKVDKGLKDEFITLAKDNLENGSQLIRKYMKKYIDNKNKKGRTKNEKK